MASRKEKRRYLWRRGRGEPTHIQEFLRFLRRIIFRLESRSNGARRPDLGNARGTAINLSRVRESPRDIGLIPVRYDTTPCLRRCVCAINDREASIMKTGRVLSGNSCERRRTVGCRVGPRETRKTSSLATLGKACLTGDICFIYSLIFHLPRLCSPSSVPLFITTRLLCAPFALACLNLIWLKLI